MKLSKKNIIIGLTLILLVSGISGFWYYKNNNWKILSEAKIKAYVTSLGIKYQAPKEGKY